MSIYFKANPLYNTSRTEASEISAYDANKTINERRRKNYGKEETGSKGDYI